ncbi:uncharacterized protein [Procambarus clarkii]|uniref:uncharacterized protein isoform X2 n=1 Tax=Procambarus clarkii TaxID=6728 RepID=UPI0037428D68
MEGRLDPHVRSCHKSVSSRVADVITRNATGISANRRQQLRRYVCSLKGKIHDVVLDTLSQDLQTASDADIDNLIQMDDDFRHLQNCRWTSLGDRERLQGLSGGFIGRIFYQRWKNCQAEENHLVKLQDDRVSSSQSPDKECPPTPGNLEGQELAPGTNCKVLAKQAHSTIQKAVSDLNEPCEWLMEQYLDLECELYGTETAVNKLEAYVEKNTDHLPAHRFSYHFYKNKVPNSNKNQIKALQKISKMCSDDPLVLEYVDLILKRAEHDIFVPYGQQEDADSDSGLDAWENVETRPIAKKENTPPCFLKSNENVNALKSCLHLLTTMLEYKELIWNLQPWQRLTTILRRFYVAWLRCWSCSLCKKSRTLVDAVGQRMTALWRHYVWTSPPALIPLEKAQVLFHHAYAAYIFCYSVDYILEIKSALFSNGYNNLALELEDSICYPGPFLKKFICYSDIKRTRLLHVGMETTSSSYLYKKGSSELHLISSPVEDTNGTEECDSTEYFESMCEENDNEGTRNDIDPLSLNNETEVNFTTGLGIDFLELQCSRRLTNCEGGKDVSFNEQDIITSTQIKAEHAVSSLPSNLALNPAHNGSFIGLISCVADGDSLRMKSIGNGIKPSDNQKKRLKHSEIETSISMEDVSSENISRNALLRVMVDRKDMLSLERREKSISNNMVIVERELSQQQQVSHCDPVMSRRLCFTLQNGSHVDDVNKLSEPKEKNSRESKGFSEDEEIKLNMHRKRSKAEAMMANSLTSPNLEHQNRDLDMNFEEDKTYDPQFLYTCSFNNDSKNLGDCDSSNVNYDTANNTSQEVNFPDVPIEPVLAESQEPDIHTANISNTANCQGCEQNVLHDCEVTNASQNVNICNASIDKDQNDFDRDSKGNSFSCGVLEEDLENLLTCGQRESGLGEYKAESSQKHGCSLPGNAEKIGEECEDFQLTPLPTSLSPDAILPCTQESVFRINLVVDETLSHMDANFIDDGVRFVPETQSQFLTETCDKDGGIGDDLGNINSMGEPQSEDNTKENILPGTQQNIIADSQYSLTPAQRVQSSDIKDVQDMDPSLHNMKNMYNADFCKTEEELGAGDQPDESLIMEDSKIGILDDSLPTALASVSVPLKHKSVNNYHLPVTPPGQRANLFSDDNTDKFNSAKSAVERIVHSQCLRTPPVDEDDQNEFSDSQEFIGPSQDEITTDAYKMYRLDLKNSHSSFSAGSTVSDSVNGSDTEVTSDNVYGSLPAMQDISFSPSQQTVQTLRPKRVQTGKENILEITPLSQMVCVVQEEELELLSHDINSGDTNCKKPSSNGSLAFASSSEVAKLQDLFYRQARNESSSNIISKASTQVINKNCNIPVNISSAQDNSKSITNKTSNIYEPLEVKGGSGIESWGFKNEEANEEMTKEYKVEAWDFRIEETEGDSMSETCGSVTGETVEDNECLFTIASGGGERDNSEPAFIGTNYASKITVDPCSKQDKRVNRLKEKRRKKKGRTERKSSEPVHVGKNDVNKLQNEKPYHRNDTGEKVRGKPPKNKVKNAFGTSHTESWNEFLDDLPAPILNQINWKDKDNIHVSHPKKIKKKKISYKDGKCRELRLVKKCGGKSQDNQDHKLSWLEDLPLPFDTLPETGEMSINVGLDSFSDQSSLIQFESSEVEETRFITKKIKNKQKAKVTKKREQGVTTDVMCTPSLSNGKVFKFKEKNKKNKMPLNDSESSNSDANKYEIDSYGASSSRVKKRKQNSENEVQIIAEISVIRPSESVNGSRSKFKKKKSKRAQLISETERALPHSARFLESDELSHRNSKKKCKDILRETEGIHGVKSVEGLRSMDFCQDPKRKLRTKKWQVDIQNLTYPCNKLKKRKSGLMGLHSSFDRSVHCEEESRKKMHDLEEEVKEKDLSINLFSSKKKKKKKHGERENIELVQEKSISMPERLSTSVDDVTESLGMMNQLVFSSNDKLKMSQCVSKQHKKQGKQTSEKHLSDIDESLKIQGNSVEVSNRSPRDMSHKMKNHLSKTKKPFSKEIAKSTTNLDVTYKNIDTPSKIRKKGRDPLSEIGYYIGYPAQRTVSIVNDDKINKLHVAVSVAQGMKRGQLESESNNTVMSMTCEYSEATVGKKAAVPESIKKRKSSARLSQRLLEKRVQPSPPWQNHPKFNRRSHKLFNPNDGQLL